jgi:MscS family membrane protein
VLSLVYSTNAAQLRKVVADIEAAVRAQPKAFQDDIVVRLKAFAAEWLEVEVNVWFLTTDYTEFGLIRQDLLLSCMEIVEKAGTAFAFPTRTVHVIDDPARPAGQAAQRAS